MLATLDLHLRNPCFARHLEAFVETTFGAGLYDHNLGGFCETSPCLSSATVFTYRAIIRTFAIILMSESGVRKLCNPSVIRPEV